MRRCTFCNQEIESSDEIRQVAPYLFAHEHCVRLESIKSRLREVEIEAAVATDQVNHVALRYRLRQLNSGQLER